MKSPTIYLYEQIASKIEKQIQSGTFVAGDKLPSLRTLCDEFGVSMNTALQSYVLLEQKSMIESRPQSGYFVSPQQLQFPDLPEATKPSAVAGVEDIEEIISTVLQNRKKCKVLLSLGTPSIDLLPVAKLNKAMIEAIRGLPDSGIGYDTTGNARLKNLIAKRSTLWNGNLQSSEIMTTAGCMDAIAYTLITLTQRGDAIAVESPVYYGILQLARNLGLRVIEMPTHVVTGIDPDDLKNLLKRRKIKLCLLVSNYNNPLGSCMPEVNKKAVVKILDQFGIPLIEDDEYGEFYFGKQRPGTCKSYDQSGNVIWCSSFSKTLAPGYRVGWLSGGRYHKQLTRTKTYHSVATNSLAQEAIARFIENNRYDNHLRKLRSTLEYNALQFYRCINAYFPENTKVSRPKGGFILWVELPKQVNGLNLCDKAVEQKISFAPGRMYTLQNQYNNCIKLSYAQPWSDKIEHGLKVVGQLARNESK